MNLPGVNAASVLTRLRNLGYSSAATARLGDVLTIKRLAFLADALLVNNDQPALATEWPFTAGGA
jgi:hypothetical protein